MYKDKETFMTIINVEDLWEDDMIENYLLNRDINEKSEKNVVYMLYKYCNLQKMTPTELIEEARSEQKQYEYHSERNLQKRLFKFRKYLKTEKYSSLYAKYCMRTVLSFYRAFEVPLPEIKMKKFPVYRKKIDDLPTDDEIRKILRIANPQLKAIILLIATSGMDGNTVRQLKYQDFYDALKHEVEDLGNNQLDIETIIEKTRGLTNNITWKVVRTKVEDFEFFTCSTPEANNAILNYLLRKPPESLDSPLFRSKNSNGPVLDTTMMGNLGSLNRRAGLKKVRGYWKVHAHSLRSYFASKMLKFKVQKVAIDFMLGHPAGTQTDEAYFVASREGVREIYDEIAYKLILEDATMLNGVNPEELQEAEKLLQDVKSKYEKLQELRAIEKERQLLEQERNNRNILNPPRNVLSALR